MTVLLAWRTPAWDVWAHLWRTQLPELIANTLTLVAGVGVGTFVVGTTLAWLVVGYRFPGSRIFEWALILPLAVPAYVIGFAFLGLFDFTGPVQTTLRQWFPGARLPELRSAWGVIVVMTLVFYPYVYLLARAAFREHGLATLETAQSLGRSRWRAFVEVVLPMARPSLVAGVWLAMMEALADFGTVSTFGYRTLTEAIYRVWTGMFDRVAATQLATLLLAFALGLLLLERGLQGRRRFTQSRRRGHGLVPVALRGGRAVAAMLVCSLVFALAFVLPVGQLVLWTMADTGGLRRVPHTFGGLLGTTFVMAAVAATAIAILGLTMAYARRLRPAKLVNFAGQFCSMGYAVPGAVIAVGVLVPVAWVDLTIGRLVESVSGQRLDFVLMNSGAAVLFAYAVRFLAVGFQTIDASLRKIPRSMDEAARSLGVTVGGTLRRIHLPLLRAGGLTALLLVWVEAMKELPATLLLRPLGVKTLAIDVWERTSESLWSEAALPALAIVAVGLVPLGIAARLLSQGRELERP